MELDRLTLQAIRDAAFQKHNATNPYEREAYMALAQAADRLDSHLVRREQRIAERKAAPQPDEDAGE